MVPLVTQTGSSVGTGAQVSASLLQEALAAKMPARRLPCGTSVKTIGGNGRHALARWFGHVA